MKHLRFVIMLVMMLYASSCLIELEDIPVPGIIKEVWNEYLAQINREIGDLQRLVDILQKKSAIRDVKEDDEYIVITFTDSRTPLRIYVGEQGSPGTYPPAVGIRQESDGQYYWTVDGDLLKDDNGKPFLVAGEPGTPGTPGEPGKDAIAPQIDIDKDGYWTISTDGGNIWKSTGKKAEGERGSDGSDGKNGDSFFGKIEFDKDSNYVKITLADDKTAIYIPRYVGITGPIDLSLSFSPPVEGVGPTPNFADYRFAGIVTWMKKDADGDFTVPVPLTEKFIADTEYAARVELRTLAGYVFSGAAGGTITVEHGNSSALSHQVQFDLETLVETGIDGNPVTRLVAKGEIPFKTTQSSYRVNDLDLTGKISAPLNSAHPTLSLTGMQYYTSESDKIKWSMYINSTEVVLNDNDQFRLGTIYKAVATLTPGTGFSFDGVEGMDFFHSGAQQYGITAEKVPDDPDGRRIVVTILFKQTGQGTATSSTLDLTPHISTPATGGTPVISFAEGSFSGFVTWTVDNQSMTEGLFQPGTKYRANVTLTPATGYYFPDDVKVSYKGKNLTPMESGNLKGYIDFDPIPGERTVSIIGDLTYLIPAPRTDDTPITDFDATGYTGKIDWGSGNTKFQAGTKYAAEVTLTAKQGYIFTGVTEASLIHNNASDVTFPQDYKPNAKLEKLSFTLTFPPTGHVEKVTDFHLTSRIPQPQGGNIPVTTFTAVEYTGAVTWDPELSSGGFTIGTAYKATVTLTAKPGYAFPGGITFIHNGATTVSSPEVVDGKTCEVEITFPATVKDKQVTDLNLTYRVPQPLDATKPVKTFTTAEYTGTVTWKQGGNSMAEN
ncbi:MAG: DUF4988 domain-containing protein, partial [Proteiniphilum sp.]|nr:DUF4988 domain-containing protein [Proteiniphilum sp.]